MRLQALEEALAATEGVVQVYSQTREGQVDLFFDQALNDATAAFNRGRGQLPDNLAIEEPRLFKVDPHSCLYMNWVNLTFFRGCRFARICR